MCIQRVSSRWLLVWTGRRVKPGENNKILNAHALNRAMFLEFTFESVPQVALQAYNTSMAQGLNSITILSIIFSGLMATNGTYRYIYYKAIKGYEFDEIPIGVPMLINAKTNATNERKTITESERIRQEAEQQQRYRPYALWWLGFDEKWVPMYEGHAIFPHPVNHDNIVKLVWTVCVWMIAVVLQLTTLLTAPVTMLLLWSMRKCFPQRFSFEESEPGKASMEKYVNTFLLFVYIVGHNIALVMSIWARIMFKPSNFEAGVLGRQVSAGLTGYIGVVHTIMQILHGGFLFGDSTRARSLQRFVIAIFHIVAASLYVDFALRDVPQPGIVYRLSGACGSLWLCNSILDFFLLMLASCQSCCCEQEDSAQVAPLAEDRNNFYPDHPQQQQQQFPLYEQPPQPFSPSAAAVALPMLNVYQYHEQRYIDGGDGEEDMVYTEEPYSASLHNNSNYTYSN